MMVIELSDDWAQVMGVLVPSMEAPTGFLKSCGLTMVILFIFGRSRLDERGGKNWNLGGGK